MEVTDHTIICLLVFYISIVQLLFRWLPRAALRSIEGDSTDCVLVVGVSRPKMALAVLIVLLLSLFLTFHLIYDTALNTLKEKPDPHHHRSAPVLLLSKRLYPDATRRLPQVSNLRNRSKEVTIVFLIVLNHIRYLQT